MQTLTPPLRQARMEFKTSSDTKELLSRAAALDGLDLTAFVLGSAIEKARTVLNEHANIALTQRGQLALVEALNRPRRPTPTMKKLMALPDIASRRTKAS